MNYEGIRNKLLPVTDEEKTGYIELCQRNSWLKRRGLAFIDDPFLEMDSPYSLVRIDGLSVLKEFFDQGNWAIRQGVRYGDLLFVNQCNGGDEWWTCKLFGNEWVPFESISFKLIIKDGEFERLIGRLEAATRQQCEGCNY